MIIVDLTHWHAKRRHFLDVGTHVPDNCWTTAGWRLTAKNPPRTFTLADGRTLRVAESRAFFNGAQTFHMAYWHLLGEDRVDYARYGTGKTFAFMWDNKGLYWRGKGEQYFLNIMSTLPVEKLEAEPLFQEILTRLANFLPLEEKNFADK